METNDSTQRPATGSRLAQLMAIMNEAKQKSIEGDEDDVTEYWASYIDVRMEQIALHFPGLAPAIRAVAEHCQGGVAMPCGCPEAA